MGELAINVCLVAPKPPPYGGISHWTSLICRFAEGRSDIRIAVLNTAPRWRAIHDKGLLKRALGGGGQLLRDIWRLVMLLSGEHFDAMHLTTSGELGVIRDIGAACLAALFNIPIFYHIRFGRVPKIAEEASLEWRALAWVMMRARAVVAIDGATGEAIRKYLPGANLRVIPNCVDFSGLPETHASGAAERTALFVGWVIPTKGVAELMEAWAMVQPEGWRLLLVGPGDPTYRDELIRRFSPRHVDFLGELPHQQAMERLAACDLLVLPSYTEGFPNAVLEAMALGKAIVASAVGAIPEMLDGGCGCLVKPMSVSDLINAIELVCADPESRNQMGKRAKERAMQNYSIDVVFRRYISLWRQASLCEDL